jgi:hypothetical protein
VTTRHYGSDIKGGAGHYIAETGATLKSAIDCPSCKFGTISLATQGFDLAFCLDCGAAFTVRDLVKRGIIREQKHSRRKNK